MEETSSIALEIIGLTAERSHETGERGIGLRGVSFALAQGEILVLTGENGSGKSLVGHLVAGLPDPGIRILDGRILYGKIDLLRARRRERRRLLRSELVVISRSAREQFNPDRSVRRWLREVVKMAGRRRELDEEKSWSDFFYRVGIVEPERILPRRLGELPALTIQRLMLLRALIGKARIVICDEATADLDRIAEAQFLALLEQVRKEENVSVLFTTGNLRGIEGFADRVGVFYEGGLLEIGPTPDILGNAAFAYTREFFVARPRLSRTPRLLPTISREAAREAEQVVHEQAFPIDPSAARKD